MKKIFSQKLKKDEGFTGQDILIAIFITMAFLSLIATMIINLSNTSYEINKTKELTELISKMADRIDQMGYSDFEDTTAEKDISEISELRSYEIPNGITMKYTVSTEGDTDNPVKVITLIGSYRASGTDNTVEIPIKKKEPQKSTEVGKPDDDGYIRPTIGDMYQYPFNTPKEENRNYNGEELIPIKFVWKSGYPKQGCWVVTTEDDPEWYSIEEGVYPTYVSSSIGRQKKAVQLKDGGQETYEVITESLAMSKSGWSQRGGYDIYVWIPRIAGNSYNYSYAFETTNYGIYAQNGGGYILSTPELASYNESIFSNTARGAFIKFSKSDSSFNNDSVYKALPSNLRSKIIFNRHDSEVTY